MGTAQIETGQQRADRTGEIAITNVHGRTLLHLLRSPDGEESLTLCGRYTFARHTGRERVDEDTPVCQVCSGRSIRLRAQRHGF